MVSEFEMTRLSSNRVATVQEKTGISMFIFPDKENTGNFQTEKTREICQNIKNMFLHRAFTPQHSDNFEVITTKRCFRVVLECRCFPLAFEANFEMGNDRMEWSFSTSSIVFVIIVQRVFVVVYVSVGSGSAINVIIWGWKAQGKVYNTVDFVLIGEWQPWTGTSSPWHYCTAVKFIEPVTGERSFLLSTVARLSQTPYYVRTHLTFAKAVFFFTAT